MTPSQPEAVPPPRAQLGLAAPVTGRAPQKYLIQNQSGLKVFYWAEKVRGLVETAAERKMSCQDCHIWPSSVTVWLCHLLLNSGAKRP